MDGRSFIYGPDLGGRRPEDTVNSEGPAAGATKSSRHEKALGDEGSPPRANLIAQT